MATLALIYNSHEKAGHLAALQRQLPRNCLTTQQALARGPKKKGQAEIKIESTDIINIFKDREDPEPLHIKTYPIYVQ